MFRFLTLETSGAGIGRVCRNVWHAPIGLLLAVRRDRQLILPGIALFALFLLLQQHAGDWLRLLINPRADYQMAYFPQLLTVLALGFRPD